MQPSNPYYPSAIAKSRPNAMHALFPVGRIIFGVAIASLGLEHLLTGKFPVALFPFPADFPGRSVAVIAIGVALVATGLNISFFRKATIAATSLGLLLLLLALYLHAPVVLANVHNGGAWTVFGELLSLSAGAFYLAGLLSQPPSTTPQGQLNLVRTGRTLFAVTLVIFGILHFQYADYVATLIPAWIPARLFWAYFVGVAFLATAISLLINRQRALSTALLGLMFLLWVLMLHAPRVIAKPQAEPEWTSLFIALAISGIAFIMAGSQSSTNSATKDYRLTITD